MMDIPFAVGRPPDYEGPLARYLPPLEQGAVQQALQGFGSPGDLVLDPFGVSPRLALEAAQCGRAVLVAANNPVTRFVLQHTLKPFEKSELQAALARLASVPKDGSRLEVFLLDLYRTQCGFCGAPVSADYFVWQRGAKDPEERAYTCARCGHSTEEPATDEDRALARHHARYGLPHALALERVAPVGDPDRRRTAEALGVYPERAIFGLMSVLAKLEQLELDAPLMDAARALLLSAFDACNALWDHPEGRLRPLQLKPAPRFRETNVWKAMEKAVTTWAMPDPGIEVRVWPDEDLPQPGVVSIFSGAVRGLAATLVNQHIQSIVTALPRPNQAYWTMAALWAAWLWGRQVAAPAKAALRRRRYDWAWHAGAIRSVLSGLREVLVEGTPALAFLSEAEPGFLSAGLAGFDAAGYRLDGRAFRSDLEQALFTWQYMGEQASIAIPDDLQHILAKSMAAALRQRGQPAFFSLIHCAGLTDLAARGALGAMWRSTGAPPLAPLREAYEDVLKPGGGLVRLDERVELESGLYWLADGKGAQPLLADRVESIALQGLRQHTRLESRMADQMVCEQLPGLQTPARRIVMACLESYAAYDDAAGCWILRERELATARAADCEEIQRLLEELGARLGYSVKHGEVLEWAERRGKAAYLFRVQETAALGEALGWKKKPRLTLVVPGGRSLLIIEKCRHDPRLQQWLESGVGMLKFRHVRRLVEEEPLRKENLPQRLGIDPPEHQDPQLPLL